MAQVAPEVVKHYEYDFDKIHEMVERKDRDILESFGGLEGLCKAWESNSRTGVDRTTLDKRRQQWGMNELDKADPVLFSDFLKEAFEDKIIILLCIAAVVSIIFGMTLENPHSGEVERATGWIEGTAIVITVAIVTLTGSIQNYQKAKKFEEMEEENDKRSVAVKRNGEESQILSSELVPGDILILEGGMMFDVDGVLIDGTNLSVNEAAMTGEGDLIKKKIDGDCFFLSGTLLEDGGGEMLVIATGMSSFQGQLKKETSGDSADTPLQEHLSTLADNIGYGGFAAAAVLVVALCIKEVILIAEYDKEAAATNFLNFLIVAVTLIVVAIPEGLPLAVTISLAFSMKAMMVDNCLVRVLASCETMGGATAICSDKTGTLTTNIMTVVQGLVNEEEFYFTDFAVHPRSGANAAAYDRNSPSFKTSADNLEKFCFSLAINSTAKEQMVDGTMQWTGNKTEHGLLGFITRTGRDYKELRASVTSDNKKQFPFNSSKKRMTTIVKDNSGLMTAYCKGASEIILDDCDQYVDADGAVVSMSPQKKALFTDIINDMANQGNRTIGIAYCPCHFTEFPEEEPGMSMVFMGVMGIQDPIRPEVPAAVSKCQSAGLVIRMVTGDNINTAIAISKKANIFVDNGFDMAMEGKELRARYDRANDNAAEKKELMELLPRIRILARSSPTDKHILVGLLQEIGEVVGVTGDGTNDAPALKLADVGFAMNTGTDIAKGAADMVLLDDNFASVVNAIRWGRAVNDNIRKFLQFQLSINVGGVLLTIIGSVASETSKEPFTPVQLLWLNLIMDTMAALALATELPDDSSLKRAPVYKQAPLIGNTMRLFIGFHAFFQSTVILLILFGGHIWFDTIEDRDACNIDWSGEPIEHANDTFTYVSAQQKYCFEKCIDEGGVIKNNRVCQQGLVHGTIIFNTFIWMQIFNIFNARKLYSELNPFEGIYPRSILLLKVFWIILIVQVIAVEVFGPYLTFMETTHLTWYYWLICVGFGILELPLGFIPRLIPVKNFVPPMVLEKKEAEEKLRAECAKGKTSRK